MLSAKSTSDAIVEQLRRMATGKREPGTSTASSIVAGSEASGAVSAGLRTSSFSSALGDERAWEMLRGRVDALVDWAAEYEKVHGYTLDPKVKEVIGLLKAKVSDIAEVVRQMLAGERIGGGWGDDAARLRLVKAVAEINIKTASRADEKEVMDGNVKVKKAAEDGINGYGMPAVSVTPGSGAAAVLPELQPVLEAAQAVAACVGMSIRSQALFTMRLAEAAAKDTVIEDQTKQIVQQVAAQMKQHSPPPLEVTDPVLKQQLAGLFGAEWQAEGEALEALTIELVRATADREAKVAKDSAEGALQALSGTRADASRLSEHIRKQNEDVARVVADVKALAKAVDEKRRAADADLRTAVRGFVDAERDMWAARRTDPASELRGFRAPPGEPTEASAVSRAESAVKACMEALGVLGHLKAGLPRALRSAEAAERLLAGCSATVAAGAARAAAEWARTAALPCEQQLADQEWFDRTTAFLRVLGDRVAKEKAERGEGWLQGQQQG